MHPLPSARTGRLDPATVHSAVASSPPECARLSPSVPLCVPPCSQAIKANGFVFVSGSLGLDPKVRVSTLLQLRVAEDGSLSPPSLLCFPPPPVQTGEFPSKDVVAQTKQSLDNMAAILTAGNSSMQQVVKTTILLADIKDFPKVNEVYATCQPSSETPHTHTSHACTTHRAAMPQLLPLAAHHCCCRCRFCV